MNRAESLAKQKIRPCGYVLTGKLKEHLAHYRQCSHPVCKERLREWEAIKEMHARDLRALHFKGAEK